jgi:alpha-L-arabinofuranosidase
MNSNWISLPSILTGLILGLVSSVSARAQSDQVIYGDSLGAGWENWSWASANFSTASPVRAGTASLSVTADGWEALYLHHSAFSTAGYTGLRFWIHGGSAGGQLLQVQATLGGVQQPPVTLPALVGNSWQPVTLSLTALGVAGKSNFDGFWIQDRSGTTRPAFYLDDITLVAVPPPASLSIAVDATRTLRTADRRHFGLNAAIWDAAFDTPTTISLLQEMQNQTLRFPGGSLSDEYHWQSNVTGNNTWQWATSFDEFAHVASNTAAQVFITVNYGTGTPAEAAAWVQYANVSRRLGFKYWEVGNENYGSWEADSNSRPHDPFTYATRFRDYFVQMKAVDPAIKVGAVVITGEDSYANYSDHPAVNPRTGQSHNGWTPVMLSTLRSLGVRPDFVIHHRYAQGPGGESDAGLLASSATWATDARDLRQQLTDYLVTGAAGVELVCTENNSVYSGPGKQTTSLVNGLFLADSLGAAMKTEFNGLVWWALRNSRETGNNNSAALYGWRNYGDYGIVSDAVPAGPADRFPTYYVAKLLRHFARGGDLILPTTSNYSLLSAYASRRADGTLRILVINKSPTTAMPARISLTGFAPSGSLTTYSYGIPQDEAARIGTGSADIATASPGGAAPTFTRTFPPYSATVLSLPGTVAVVRRPDAWIKLPADPSHLGNNIYNTDGSGQTRSVSASPGTSATFNVTVQNDASATDAFTLRGTGGSTGFTVRYYSGLTGGVEITSQILAGTYPVTALAAGGISAIRAVVTVAAGTPSGTIKDYLLTVTSTGDATQRDAVKARVTVP